MSLLIYKVLQLADVGSNAPNQVLARVPGCPLDEKFYMYKGLPVSVLSYCTRYQGVVVIFIHQKTHTHLHSYIWHVQEDMFPDTVQIVLYISPVWHHPGTCMGEGVGGTGVMGWGRWGMMKSTDNAEDTLTYLFRNLVRQVLQISKT